jgi:hypothetical protein
MSRLPWCRGPSVRKAIILCLLLGRGVGFGVQTGAVGQLRGGEEYKGILVSVFFFY